MAIKKAGLAALLSALALLLSTGSAFAQAADKDAAAESDKGAAAADGDKADKDGGEAEKDGDGDGDGEPASGLDELCEIDPENCVRLDMNKAAQRAVQADMYAVQQIWALRERRFELGVYGSFSMNDQFVAHPGPGVSMTYYVKNWLGFGVNGNIYAGFNSTSDFNFQTSRAARIGQPITEYQWNANANVVLVPAYGKFSAFKNFIFHYDFFFTFGGGAISTRPIAVVDPDNRTFDFSVTGVGSAGGGIRIFFTRYLSATLEIRDYIFGDRLENPAIATGFDSQGAPLAQNQDTWETDRELTNNVQAQIGLSVFLPFTWKYRLPK